VTRNLLRVGTAALGCPAEQSSACRTRGEPTNLVISTGTHHREANLSEVESLLWSWWDCGPG